MALRNTYTHQTPLKAISPSDSFALQPSATPRAVHIRFSFTVSWLGNFKSKTRVTIDFDGYRNL